MRILILFVSLACAAFAQEGTLRAAEKLTVAEQAQICAATSKVMTAQQELANVKSSIAAAHKMSAESWMEWSSWYEFDGEYILSRFKNHMPTISLSTTPGVITLIDSK